MPTFISIGCGAIKTENTSSQASERELLSRPLIVGASVSANYGTASPGRRLALRYTTPDKIRTVARGGTPGAKIMPTVTDQVIEGRSVILAMDALFWDSTLPDSHASVRAFEALVKRAASHKVPIVIGDIPALIPEAQTGRAKLNQTIHALCATYSRCRVLGLDELHRKLISDGYLLINGRRLTIHEIVPDGLHLSEPAAEFLADRILKALLG